MAANVNNYINAANAAIRNNVQMRKTLADNKARLGDIAGEGVMQDAKNRVADAENNLELAKEKMRQEASDEMFDDNKKTAKEILNIKKRTNMAGKLAAGAGAIGVGYMMKNAKQEENEQLADLKNQIEVFTKRGTSAESEYKRIMGEEYPGLKPAEAEEPTFDTAPVPVGDQSNSLGDLNNIFNQSANITGAVESDAYGGYNAYNLGGSDEGRTPHGSGDSSDGKRFGAPLTHMNIGQIKKLQKAGMLHAAGRFQFIANSLPEAAQFAGLSDNDRFSPDNQNLMYMAFGKKYGSGRWVGLEKVSDDQRSIVDRSFREWNPAK